MKFLVLLVGIFTISASITFFMFPGLIDELIKWVGKKRNLLYVVLIRLTSGTILVAGAHTTHHPTLIWWLGVLFIVAGMVLLFFPAKTIKRITTVWLSRSTAIQRAWVAIPVAIGAFVVYSVM
jgi:phosphate starvation-inducible membrane PsiE